MSTRTPLDFSAPLATIIAQFSDGDGAAKAALEEVIAVVVPRKLPLLPTLVDVDDMQMRGAQIAHAYAFAGHDPERFIEMCAARDEAMVAAVNAAVPEHQARAHGPQTRVSPVDHAVKAAMESAGHNAEVRRVDTGAELVHQFFMGMLIEMQAKSQFVSNYRLALGMEGATYAVFAIQLVELLDSDGKPIAVQPTKEAERVSELTAEKAACSVMRSEEQE